MSMIRIIIVLYGRKRAINQWKVIMAQVHEGTKIIDIEWRVLSTAFD